MQFAHRIGIDCRLAGAKHAGIGRYIQELVTRLPALAPQIEWVLFFHEEEQSRQVLGDVIHLQNLKYQGKIAVTIHDLLWHEHQGAEMTTLPSWQYQFKHLMYRYVVRQAVQRATVIFVPAETIRNTVSSYYPKVASKIVVTKEGVNEHFFCEEQASRPKIDKKLIYVGSLYPHKNIKLVINALAQLPEYTLVIAGTRNIFQEHIREYVQEKKLSNQVEFLGYVSDEDLCRMYQHSFALVQPSLSEGFGLTGVEAMAAGIPVLASKISIFTEIYQDAAIYFDPFSVSSFREAVSHVAQLDRSEMVRKGKTVAQQYSWEKMAQETLQKCMEILAS